MVHYNDIDNDSGVSAYEINPTYISIKFSGTAKVYTYSYRIAGRANVEEMKSLAKAGTGLNAYINRFVKFKYDR